MKRIALLLFSIASLSAADALTVDPSGKVGVGTATPTSTLDVAGTATATNVIVNRATQAAATEAVRGDDPRMANARPANGGNAATVGGLTPSAFVAKTEKGAANGVASLDAAGKVPLAMLPLMAGTKGIQFFTTSGTFTVPAGVTQFQVILLGGGSGGMQTNHIFTTDNTFFNWGAGGNAGGFAWVQISNPQPTYTVTIGQGGTLGPNGSPGGTGGASTFGSIMVCNGGTAVDGGTVVLTGVTGMAIKGATIADHDVWASYSREAAGGYMFGAPGSGFGSGGHPGHPGRPGLCVVMW